MARTKLTPQTIDLVAERFRTLGEPMRLRLLETLRSGGGAILRPETSGSTRSGISTPYGTTATGCCSPKRRISISSLSAVA